VLVGPRSTTTVARNSPQLTVLPQASLISGVAFQREGSAHVALHPRKKNPDYDMRTDNLFFPGWLGIKLTVCLSVGEGIEEGARGFPTNVEHTGSILVIVVFTKRRRGKSSRGGLEFVRGTFSWPRNTSRLGEEGREILG